MSNSTRFDIRDKVGHLVAKLFHAIAGTFAHDLARYDVSPPLFAILISLHQKKADTPSKLARYVSVDAAAVTRIIDRLEAAALVVRKPGADRRSIRVELTEAGRELTPKLVAVAESVNAKFLKGIPEAEVAQFKSTLRKMLKNLGGVRMTMPPADPLRPHDHS